MNFNMPVQRVQLLKEALPQGLSEVRQLAAKQIQPGPHDSAVVHGLQFVGIDAGIHHSNTAAATRRPLQGGGQMAVIRSQKAGLHQHRSEEHTSELQSLMRISYAV